MPTNSLKLLSAQVALPTEDESLARGAQARLAISIAVENQGTAPLYVCASAQGYDYDAQTKVLTLRLSQQPPAPPPGVIIISQHPRTPAQIEVAPGTQANLQVQIPPTIRRAASDGHGWVEDPIGDVTRVDADVQYSPTPIQAADPHESPEKFRTRMLQNGQLAHAQLRVSSPRQPKRQKE